ncbi:CidA/LrgA family protein [Pseudoalteromonas mariniglutinosa]|uniref:CidA/LrgA family protein n=1 Tax=Pseudoalteromonas mariniglutinosa TaxID=206042 RepID=UPI00385035F0
MKYLYSSAIILLCLGLAKFLSNLIDSPFPTPLLAMLILLLLLLSGVVKEHQLKPCASPLLNFMPIFFIPAGVGIIEHLTLIGHYWPLLICVLIFVPLTSVLLIASIIAYFRGRHNDI